ncbi:hypothetical protein [Sphingopyxis sp. FD7]|jgi:hypothetical protein|uniref:hypothetical protein n=1 Tax=Sphingopyxis sp. FD7 TaxID=1914525 RepID=UPI000DC61A8E|nr:hypothetical protein [Sphingopyxis sp. FD7]BBB13452.1 acetate kinase [Sphingopyxis sp. FD7]
MSDLQFKLAVQRVTRGKFDIGLSGVLRDLYNAGLPDLGGAQVARQLRALGYRRDGWHGTGYDRTPRYVWGNAS